MTLDKDRHFTWTVSEGGQNQSFSGNYVRQDDELILTRQDGQKMDATVTAKSGNVFSFRLKNTSPNDPGLEFSKTQTPPRSDDRKQNVARRWSAHRD